MHNAAIVSNQIVLMCLYALCGYILAKSGKLPERFTVGLSNLLVYVATPSIIIFSMQRPYSADEAKALVLAFLLAGGSYGLCILFAYLFIHRRSGLNTAGVDRFSIVLPNTGYIGIPLVQAVLGEEGVFFLTAYVVGFNLLLFSWARHQLLLDAQNYGGPPAGSPFSADSLRRSLINPATISVTIGLTLYFSGISLPPLLLGALEGTGALNSVLAMFIVGIFLSQTKLRTLFCFPRGLLISAIRLLLLPLITLFLIAMLPLEGFGPYAPIVKTVTVIAASTPVGTAASYMSELCGADNIYGVRLVLLSCILSLVTLPVILLIWDFACALFA